MDKYVKEFEEIVKNVSKQLGTPINSGFRVIDRGMPHEPPKNLENGTMGVYTFLYNDEFLKIGKAGPKSKARFTTQHYNHKSSNSNLSKSILTDKTMTKTRKEFKISKKTVGKWIKNNTRRIDIVLEADIPLDKKQKKFALALIEAALHYKYMPRYEG